MTSSKSLEKSELHQLYRGCNLDAVVPEMFSYRGPLALSRANFLN